MKMPNSPAYSDMPTKKVGEEDISKIRKNIFVLEMEQYPTVLASFCQTQNYHYSTGEKVTDETLLNTLAKHVMELCLSAFITRIFASRAQAEIDPKAHYYFNQFKNYLIDKFETYVTQLHAQGLDLEKINANYEKAVVPFENQLGHKIIWMLSQEKGLDWEMDEVLFWNDLFEAIRFFMPAMAPIVNFMWNKQKFEQMFDDIKKGMKYNG